MLQFIRQYAGWRNWAVFQYNSIFENLFVVFYIILRNQIFSIDVLINVILFICFSFFSTTFGYLVNDLADIELDKKHGKSNTFADDSKLKAGVITFGSFLISIFFTYPFWKYQWFMVFWVSWILIAAFYSLPPLRLKERGKIGLVFVVTAQRLLPALLIFSAFNFSRIWEIVLISFYVFLRGLSSDINHQLDDYKSDLETKTNTFAVETGYAKVKKIFNINIELEKILLLMVLVLFQFTFTDFSTAGFLILMALSGLYITAYLYSKLLEMKGKGTINTNPFRQEDKNIFQFLHHSYPSVILPVGLNVIVLILQPWFIIILIFQILIRRIFSIKIITESYMFDSLKKLQQKFVKE